MLCYSAHKLLKCCALEHLLAASSGLRAERSWLRAALRAQRNPRARHGVDRALYLADRGRGIMRIPRVVERAASVIKWAARGMKRAAGVKERETRAASGLRTRGMDWAARGIWRTVGAASS